MTPQTRAKAKAAASTSTSTSATATAYVAGPLKVTSGRITKKSSISSQSSTKEKTAIATARVAFTNGYNPTKQPGVLASSTGQQKSWQWRYHRGNAPDGVSDWDWADAYHKMDWQIGIEAANAKPHKVGAKVTAKGTADLREAERLSGDTRARTIAKLKDTKLTDNTMVLPRNYVDAPAKH